MRLNLTCFSRIVIFIIFVSTLFAVKLQLMCAEIIKSQKDKQKYALALFWAALYNASVLTEITKITNITLFRK